METETEEVTELLLEWGRGNRQALDQLMPIVVTDLHKLAKGYLDREPAGHTLQPTALVNELYLRFAGNRQIRWQDRAHFFAFAARAMRRILVDHARAKKTAKRGSDVARVALDEALDQAASRDVDLLALDDALETLATMDERQNRIVELRVFVGLGLREVAEVVGVSATTVSREWASAKAWLHHQIATR